MVQLLLSQSILSSSQQASSYENSPGSLACQNLTSPKNSKFLDASPSERAVIFPDD